MGKRRKGKERVVKLKGVYLFKIILKRKKVE